MGLLDLVRNVLKKESEYLVFDGSNWTPAEQMVIRDAYLKNTVENLGYCVLDVVDENTLMQLERVYAEYHASIQTDGGMFYSVYSQDLDYRRNVHNVLGSVLKPLYDTLFTSYKTVLNSFIVKHNGPKSEFYLHQDSTGLNEWQYSPLSVWIPLQDTNVENGCMWVIPKSHGTFSPYRGISFPSMFDAHQDLLKPYLTKIEVRKGQALIFDNRIVHLSGANNSKQPRIVVMSGVFPQEASMIAVYRDAQNNGPIEIFEEDEDFLLKNRNFYIDCTARPVLGNCVHRSYSNKLMFSEKELSERLEAIGVKSSNDYTLDINAVNCEIIQEPK